MLKKIYDFILARKLLSISILAFILLNIFIFPRINEELEFILANGLILSFISYLIVFGKDADHKKVLRNVFLYGAPIAAISFSLLFLIRPLTADWLAYEDFIVEYATAIFSLVGAFILAFVAVLLFRKKKYLVASSVVVLVLGFFVIAMEEISWGQRIFGIESSEYFVENNMQGEINLHNLDTMSMMVAFTVVTFIFFVVVPFFTKGTKRLLRWLRLEKLEVLLPAAWLIPVYALAFGFASGITVLGIAILAFIVMVLLHQFSFNNKYKDIPKATVLMALGALIFSLIVMIAIDLEAVGARLSSPTEYREFFMCLAILAYSIDIAFRLTSKKYLQER